MRGEGDYLRDAAERLASVDLDNPRREDLAEAFRRIWFASAEWRDLPREVRYRAQRLFPLFFRRGLIAESAASMNDSQARHAARALRRFLELAQASVAPRKPR